MKWELLEVNLMLSTMTRNQTNIIFMIVSRKVQKDAEAFVMTMQH